MTSFTHNRGTNPVTIKKLLLRLLIYWLNDSKFISRQTRGFSLTVQCWAMFLWNPKYFWAKISLQNFVAPDWPDRPGIKWNSAELSELDPGILALLWSVRAVQFCKSAGILVCCGGKNAHTNLALSVNSGQTVFPTRQMESACLNFAHLLTTVKELQEHNIIKVKT